MLSKPNIKSGFTLIELMIGIAIGGILLAIAIPSFSDLQKNNCLTTNANNLVTSLQTARSVAIKHNSDVTLTASNAGVSTNEWGTGWTITINEDRNGNGNLDTGEDYDGDGTLDASASVRVITLGCSLTTIDETGNNTTFTYGSDGFIDAGGTFNICDDRTGETGRQLTILSTGRPSIDSTGLTCG